MADSLSVTEVAKNTIAAPMKWMSNSYYGCPYMHARSFPSQLNKLDERLAWDESLIFLHPACNHGRLGKKGHHGTYRTFARSSPTMSTQYNTIQAPYDEWRTTSIALIERDNVRSAVAPYIKGSRVLDLACGSGFYTHQFIEWGADRVVCVDISSAMLDKATRGATDASKVKFIEQDCSKAQVIDDGQFDLVFGAWLLNYAETKEGLVEMLRLVEVNLKDGGVFVGVTMVPTDDPRAFVKVERDVRPAPGGSGGLLLTVTEEVEDGVKVHVYADKETGEVNFDCWHLRKDVYEEAVRAGGLVGEVEWRTTSVTDEFSERREGGASREELESYRKVPHYGMVVVRK